MDPTLGQEIRRLRIKAGYTLTRFAKELGITAPYLSDIEHDRRRPSEEKLRQIAEKLKPVGATYDGLERLITRLDQEIRGWADATPGARALLRKLRESGRDPREVLREIEEAEKRNRKKKK
jgi:transcriptional regulator with XRE-family HTH domain